MEKVNLGCSGIMASRVVLGNMRINAMSKKEVAELIHTAISSGINMFDHADIYGGGICEELYGGLITPSLREKVIIQTKCGIRKGYYDFSKEHILESVDGSLKRLQMEYIDILLLHRPDALMEPEEVADAFNQLSNSGKVRAFGVSNFNPTQIELLQRACNQKIIVNQMQFGPAHTPMIDRGINVNTMDARACDRDGGILDYCQLHNITMQTWSPFQYGAFEGLFIHSPKYEKLNEVIDRLAEQYGVTNSAIVTAWILRHPAKMQMIAGTTSVNRIKEMAEGAEITLTRPEWYEIYRAAGNPIP